MSNESIETQDDRLAEIDRLIAVAKTELAQGRPLSIEKLEAKHARLMPELGKQLRQMVRVHEANQAGGHSITGDSTSSGMLSRARRRDEASWRQILSIYGPLVYGWYRNQNVPPEDAQDLTQETFSNVANKLHTFESRGKGSFRAWLWAIARNNYKNLLGRLNRNPKTAKMPEIAHLSEHYDAQPEQSREEDRLRILREALSLIENDVEPRSFQAFWRTVVDGLTSREAGEELGMRPSAVREAKRRLLEKLREELTDLEDI